MLTSVVARVVVPVASRTRHAWKPSQVPGIWMQTRFVSNTGSRWEKILGMPGGRKMSVCGGRIVEVGTHAERSR